jgi:hypothetical protein
VDGVSGQAPLTLTAMPHYVAVRPAGSDRVAAYAKPLTLSIGLAPDDAIAVTRAHRDFRLEQTSAATHHVHVPAAAVDDPSRRQAARAALQRALGRAH